MFLKLQFQSYLPILLQFGPLKTHPQVYFLDLDEFDKLLPAKCTTIGYLYEDNKDWIKKLRISKDNFAEFQKTYGPEASKAYASSLKKGEDFFVKKGKTSTQIFPSN